MTTTTMISPACRYEIRPPFLFRWEDSQQAHVLLYPEGIVKLNVTGGEILRRCDAIRNGVLNFLEVSHGKGWIRAKA
ncbi:MAG: pyrroloquinoline quinone biosynthesis peptide chaperone PqqD [Gammaproteobacteria bacterium HGW-Gammaproteobacteria-9]|nr:MAG: pyrroloquinoline quinone biosynthesis peptide chaperone PqqD [Gammaproteobacteria bacterium HGW-Gammaproteobacteria-9]